MIYRLHGLVLDSDRPLAGLAPGPAGAPIDVTIRHAPAMLPDAVRIDHSADRDEALLAIPGVGTYRIAADRIEVAADAGPVAQTFLFGSAFAVLLYLRGLLPLHGAALVREGRAVILLARSGGGKSTQAAWLARSGWTLLADDVVALSVTGDRAMVAPGLARVRLCDDAWEQAGRPAAERVVLPDGRAKWVVPAEPAGAAAVVTAVVLLDRAAPGTAAALDPLSPGQLLPELVRHSFRGTVVPRLGRTRQHFGNCVQVAGYVAGWRFARAMLWPDMADATAALDAGLRDILHAGR